MNTIIDTDAIKLNFIFNFLITANLKKELSSLADTISELISLT